MARPRNSAAARRSEIDADERAADDWRDEQTLARLEHELRRNPDPPSGKRPWDFSCAMTACEVRQSRYTDPDVAYSARCGLWFCSTSHREQYLGLRFG